MFKISCSKKCVCGLLTNDFIHGKLFQTMKRGGNVRMFTLLKSNKTDFNKGKMNSFISFIFSIFKTELFRDVFHNVSIPGICGIS